MVEEYQAIAQTGMDHLEQVRVELDDLVWRLAESYPEEERTWRMGQAMKAISSASVLAGQAFTALQQIEWPTEDRPR